MDAQKPPTALSDKPFSAPAIAYVEEHGRSGDEAAAAPSKRSVTVGTGDILAIGVIVLAAGAVFVAAIVAVGFASGNVPAQEATPIILGCVGGSSIASIVVLLVKAR